MPHLFSLSDRERLEETRKYLIANKHKTLTQGHLCGIAIMNRQKLNEGFKKYYGKNILSYLKDIRMQEAKELLETTDMSVVDIADNIGYGYESNFRKAFKKHFGFTAGSLRRNR